MNPDKDFIADFQRRVAAVPDRERERMRRLTRLEGARLDASHPPTVNRIAVLQQHAAPVQLVTLTHSMSERIDAELSSLRDDVQNRLADEAADALYA